MGWRVATLAAVLGVVALTVWAAVIAGVIEGPAGVLAGAVLTALAGVAAGYVPGIRAAALRRRADLTQLESDEAADLEALRRAGELPGEGPAGLLDPRRGLVGFTGRELELAGLLAWCQDVRPRGVRLVTGPGGVGKTRLSVELCARLDPDQWRCVRVGEGEEGSALAVARRGWPGRVLLVIDYAETRLGLGGLVRQVAGDAGPVRVLLLARSAGEWRDRLAAAEPAVRELLAAAGGDEPLAAAVSGELSNQELVRAAVPVFAAALGAAAPPGVVVEAGAGAGAVRVLDLHAAALVAVLRSAGAEGPVRVRVADVLAELLGHEERFWQGTAGRLGLLGGAAGMSAEVLREVVAAGALLGAGSQEQAVELLGRVPGAVASVPVACWLRDLYPPEAGTAGVEWLGSLRPDRLAERLVVTELAASAELAGRCLTELDERQALRAVTLLGRAAADRQEEAESLLERVLPLLEQVVAGLPGDIGLLTAISDAIPYPSAALAEADLAVTRRILQVLPDDDPGFPGLRARWVTWLGITLSQTGSTAEALPVTQEALEIYQELADANPEQYRPDLAASLSNLGVLFSELGRPAEALPVTQEAVEIYQELADANPEQYRPDLAASLSNLGVLLSALGRPVEALPPAQEAVKIRRELARAYPDRYPRDLATSLSNLGILFSKLGRPAEALPVTQEAVETYRELARAYPDRYRPALAASLSNLGVPFSALGRPAEALLVTQEAIEIMRELTDAYPDRYRPDLATSLSNLGNRFSELGRPAEALPPAQEAVQTRRELARAYPDRYRPDLATSLSNLGNRLSALGRPADALPPAQEATEIMRELADAHPDQYRPDLAISLSNLGNRLSALSRPADALPPAQEATEIMRELADAHPDRYRPDLAGSLSNLGIRFSALGRLAEALPVTQEAVEIRRQLADTNPDRYRPELATSLSNLGVLFLALGRPAEALPVTQEAIEIRRELTDTNPDRYRPELARSLQALAHELDALGHTAEAEAARNEANLGQ